MTCYSSGDPRIDLWDNRDGRHLATLRRPSGDAGVMGLHPSGKLLAVGGYGRGVDVWNVENRELVMTLETDAEVINCIAFSPDGSLLSAADNAGMPTAFCRSSSFSLTN